MVAMLNSTVLNMFYQIIFDLHLEINVSLQQPRYFVTEGQTSTICANVMGDRNIAITVSIATALITAEGKIEHVYMQTPIY